MSYQDYERWKRENVKIEPCHFCGDMPAPIVGEPFSHFFGVAVCEWCWESDEYMDWSEQKWREAGIPLDGKTGMISDDYARYIEQLPKKISIWKRIKRRLQS